MTGAIDPYQKREFRCSHCNGRIVIPADLPPTTGPCPHCGGVITSPAFIRDAAPIPAAPAPTSAAIPAQPAEPVPVPAPVVPPQPSAPVQASPVVPVKKEAVPVEPEPAQPAAARAVSVPMPVRAKKRGLIPALLIMLLLVIAAGAGAWYLFINTNKTSPPKGAPAMAKQNEEEYLRSGWQKDAANVLRGYMSASTAEEKANYVIGGKSVIPKLNEFYGGGKIDDSDTPAEAFSIYELSIEDRRRGLFMMIYDQPPQFEMRDFFRPLATIEVQYGVQEADMLLASVAKASNFTMEPVRAQAFFKRTPEGLKLDWDMFAQTKYRALRNFIEIPNAGRKAVFRVFLVEDVPEEGKSVTGMRTYRIADPGNTTDSTRINVKVDSEPGKVLSLINWRGTKDIQPVTRTATIELEWVGKDDPQLAIHRFICWEFLGLGGEDQTGGK